MHNQLSNNGFSISDSGMIDSLITKVCSQVFMRILYLLSALLVAFFLVAGCEVQNNTKRYTTEETKNYYDQLTKFFQDNGYLKTDRTTGINYSPKILAMNFERIALYSEYTLRGGRYIRSKQQIEIRKWEQPVRINVMFGKSVSPEKRKQDMKSIRQYVKQLQSITGHPLTITSIDPNFHVFIINSDEQAIVGNALRKIIQYNSDSVEYAIVNSPLEIFCSAYTIVRSNNSPKYAEAVIHIKSEQPDIMRLSCIHEEFAQAMGLINDDNRVRPSIFNDDEEYALLTEHDEMMLKILYDPRIKIGMKLNEVHPIALEIAGELLANRQVSKLGTISLARN